MLRTTFGWKLLGKLADDSKSWISLKDMKEANPVDLANFFNTCDTTNNTNFVWWVPYNLCKQDFILSKIKASIHKKAHKYSIEILTKIYHTNSIDRENKNTLLQDEISKQMTNTGVASEVLAECQSAPPTWSKVTGNLVQYLKMDFTKKPMWVLHEHKTTYPIGYTY